MNKFDVFQVVITLVTLAVCTPILGTYMAKVFEGQRTLLSRVARPLEVLLYKLGGVSEREEMSWRGYAKALLWFNFFGFVMVFVLQILQGSLTLNPTGAPNVSWHLAFNTAISFMTNTNWQAYSGETMLSYLTQMMGLTVQNFVSASTGIAVAVALARGLAPNTSGKVGNFWVDLTRGVVYILLPLSVVFAIVLTSQGVIQTFADPVQSTTLEGAAQTIPLGPAASQIAIKQLGTNGGGFFNANSAHPFENPTPFSNWLQLIAILLIPTALAYTFGVIVKARRQGIVIFLAMSLLLIGGLGLSLWSEYSANPVLGTSSVMEGKETRFGVTNSVLWSVFTTAASNGSVNSMHSSLSPISGAVALTNIMLGEIIFGGVGAGLYGMLLFVLLTVFLAGLMVGRTPEYLGKKIESREIQMVILAILAPSALILVGSGISAVLPVALSSLTNKGPHGLTEILYAFSSAAGNNGSAFAGLNANTPYYNIALGVCMLIGRFAVIVPALAIAGSMALKKSAPPSFGTFTTDNALFVVLLIGVVLIVGGLTFFPALALGPIVEHFLMQAGRAF
ncbi:MAG: potassium-transporting ATPase subunit KdpA [Bacteriovoracia bacterium]